MPNFKVPLKKESLQVGEVLIILNGDTSCHIKGLHSYVYAILSTQNGKVCCLLIVNDDRHLVRELDDRLVPGHGEGVFWIFKSLELHETILRA